MLKQVCRHLWFFERVAYSDGSDLFEQDRAKLIHGLRVDFQRLLQKLHALQILRYPHLSQ